jgi:AI-2 transport protein TqsA
MGATTHRLLPRPATCGIDDLPGASDSHVEGAPRPDRARHEPDARGAPAAGRAVPEKGEERAWYRTWLPVVGVVALVWFLHLTRHVTMPMGFALFVAVLLSPVQRWLLERAPKALAQITTIVLLSIVCVAFCGAVGLSIDVLVRSLKEDLKPNGIKNSLNDVFDALGIEWTTVVNEATPIAAGLAKSVLIAVETVALGYVFAVLAIIEGAAVRRRIAKHLDPAVAERILGLSAHLASRFRHYVYVRTVNGLLAGALAGGLCFAVGLEKPLAWGALTWLAYYVPTLGHVGAAVPPTLLAIGQFGEWERPVILVVGYLVIELVVGEFLDPRMQGTGARVSPLLVLFSVVFWGWVWGIPGAILGAPITFALMTLLAAFERTRPLAVLLGHTDRERPSRDNEARTERASRQG